MKQDKHYLEVLLTNKNGEYFQKHIWIGDNDEKTILKNIWSGWDVIQDFERFYVQFSDYSTATVEVCNKITDEDYKVLKKYLTTFEQHTKRKEAV